MDNIKAFKYKDYSNCHFIVSSYACEPKALAISIIDENQEPITVSTVYMDGYVYTPWVTAIKNYSENSGMTQFLQSLGIITEILDRRAANEYVADTLNTSDPQTIDWCVIDTDKLKKYAKEWYYV